MTKPAVCTDPILFTDLYSIPRCVNGLGAFLFSAFRPSALSSTKFRSTLRSDNLSLSAFVAVGGITALHSGRSRLLLTEFAILFAIVLCKPTSSLVAKTTMYSFEYGNIVKDIPSVPKQIYAVSPS